MIKTIQLVPEKEHKFLRIQAIIKDKSVWEVIAEYLEESETYKKEFSVTKLEEKN